MKRIVSVLIAATLFLTGCAGGSGKKTFSTLADFEGAKIGTMTGTSHEGFVDHVVPDVTYKEFNTISDQVDALSSDKVDAITLDMPFAQYIIAQRTEYAVFPDAVTSDNYGFAFAKGSSFAGKADEALQRLMEDGTIDQLAGFWFSMDESQKELPELTYKEDFDGSAGTLTYGFESAAAPMCYLGSDGQPLGFDLDIVSRIAYEMNMKVEFVPMNFAALLAALASGKVDMVGGCMSITEERQQSVDFIGPYYEGSTVLLIKKERLGK